MELTKMKISIAIPTYECYGKGWLFLSEILHSIYKQDFNDFEVVISDQSTDDTIREFVELYKKQLPIKLVCGRDIERQISANMNNAIRNCSGQYIKPMCMDDFFCSEKALSTIVNTLDRVPNFWTAHSTLHCESINFLSHVITPSYHAKIHLGANSMSGPSLVTFKEKVYFDEKLTMLMDCEMYKRIHDTYGPPYIIKDVLGCNRHHDKQTQRTYTGDIEAEKRHCIEKHGK
jgi:glycosyltransferase involved in cell wall biosynthesis